MVIATHRSVIGFPQVLDALVRRLVALDGQHVEAPVLPVQPLVQSDDASVILVPFNREDSLIIPICNRK